MHLLNKDPVKFERQSLFRFDAPPEGFQEFETCYVGCSPEAAFLETLGALQPLPEGLINERVITEVEHPGEQVPLADLTDDRALRYLGLYFDPYVRDYVTDDMDRPGLDYSFTQNLARELWRCGYKGAQYFTSRQRQPVERSAVLFAEAGHGHDEFKGGAPRPVPSTLLSKMQEQFGIEILPSDILLW